MGSQRASDLPTLAALLAKRDHALPVPEFMVMVDGEVEAKVLAILDRTVVYQDSNGHGPEHRSVARFDRCLVIDPKRLRWVERTTHRLTSAGRATPFNRTPDGKVVLRRLRAQVATLEAENKGLHKRLRWAEQMCLELAAEAADLLGEMAGMVDRIRDGVRLDADAEQAGAAAVT